MNEKLEEVWLTFDDRPVKLYIGHEVDALLYQIKRCAYGSSVWHEIDDLIDGATDSASAIPDKD